MDQKFNNTSDSSTYPYAGIAALLICWEEDDAGCLPGLQKMHADFQNWNIVSRIVKIPSVTPFAFLESELYTFKRDSMQCFGNDCLLLVYYGGHGHLDSHRRMRFKAHRGEKSISPSLDWTSLQSSLENCASDVLIILDCCAAAGASGSSNTDILTPTFHEGGRTELICACGFDNTTPDVGPYVFTEAIRKLFIALWEKNNTISVAQLHRILVATMQRQHSSNDAARPYGDPLKEGFSTPVYICLNHDYRAPSIPLRMRWPDMPLRSGSTGAGSSILSENLDTPTQSDTPTHSDSLTHSNSQAWENDDAGGYEGVKKIGLKKKGIEDGGGDTRTDQQHISDELAKVFMALGL